jgi:hypothetical protein
VFLHIGGAGGLVLFFEAPVGGHRQFGISVAPGGLNPYLGGDDIGLGGFDMFLGFD